MVDSNSSHLAGSFPILFGSRWRARGLDEAIAAVDPAALCAEFVVLRDSAPRRSRTGKPYFVGHSGVPSAAEGSNRLEELIRCSPTIDGWRIFVFLR